MSENESYVNNYYQGIFITETVLGNPNGSFINNEPRNIDGRVFTTDKCIKYNIRNYLHQYYEEIGEGEKPEKFVFFYPRNVEDSGEYKDSYMTKTQIFKEYFDSDFDTLLESCIDTRMFGGTFSFKEGMDRSIYGPIQISYGLDQIGSDIINLRVGTPFSSEKGKQKTTGEERVVDHAVISYDVSVNPNNSPELLKEKDLDTFKESIIKGTNLRKSTSKKTDAKALILFKFQEGSTLNIGNIKGLIGIDSEKITDPKNQETSLEVDASKVEKRIKKYGEEIEKIEIMKDEETKINKFNFDDSNIEINKKGFHKV